MMISISLKLQQHLCSLLSNRHWKRPNSLGLVFVVCALSVSSCRGAFQCNRIDDATSNCKCQFNDTANTVIDFSPLGKTDGTPRFPFGPYTTVQPKFDYAFNPCYAFSSANQKCDGVSVCQQLPTDLSQTFAVGDPNPTAWTTADDETYISVTYSSTTDETRTSQVQYTCDKTKIAEPTLAFLGEDPTRNYKFTLSTCLACLERVDGCPYAPSPSSQNLTIGGILCITFAVLVVVYLVGGILYNRFATGATGTEMIPNLGFWSDFPLLVKDGCVFLFSLCKKDEGYSSI